jgi:hypothetical protein
MRLEENICRWDAKRYICKHLCSLIHFKNRENFYQQAKETGTGAGMNVWGKRIVSRDEYFLKDHNNK